LTAISQVNSSTAKVKVGDTVCYRVEVDQLRTDYDQDSLTGFEVNGMPPYFSFKTITWSPMDSAFQVCIKVNSRFGADGLVISSLEIRSTRGAELNCNSGSGTSLVCGSTALAYKAPLVDNPNPTVTPPSIQVREVPHSSSIHLTISSSAPMSVGEIAIGFLKSQIIYERDFKSSFEVPIDTSNLGPGLSPITSLKFMDNVGNVSMLKAGTKDGKYQYLLYQPGADPQATGMPVISIMGGN
jgi:hypothetical protein